MEKRCQVQGHVKLGLGTSLVQWQGLFSLLVGESNSCCFTRWADTAGAMNAAAESGSFLSVPAQARSESQSFLPSVRYSFSDQRCTSPSASRRVAPLDAVCVEICSGWIDCGG